MTVSMRPQLGLAYFGVLLVGVSVGMWGIVLPDMILFYKIDNVALGFLFFSSAIGFFVSALVTGFLIQKLGLRWYLILGAVLAVVSGILICLEPPFFVMIIARILMGASAAAIETGFNIFLADVPDNVSPLNYLHAFFGVGALLGPPLASTILSLDWQWNTAFIIWSIFSLLFLVCLLKFFKEQPARIKQEQDTEKRDEGGLLQALKLPALWLATLFLLFYVGVETSVGNWSYSFLLEDRNMQEAFAGWIVSGYWLGLTLGRFVLSTLAQRLNMSLINMMSLCIAGTGLSTLLIWFFPNPIIDSIGFALLGFFLGPIFPTTVALMPDLVPAKFVSASLGFLIGLSIVGIAIFPWIAGVLAQFTSIWSLVPFTIALTLIMLAFWVSVVRRLAHKTT